MLRLSSDLRDLVQSRKFDNLFEGNVPYAGFEKVNLLKTQDLNVADTAELMKKGFADILHHPTANIISSAIHQQKMDLELERKDRLKASQIQIKFVSYKTPLDRLNNVPQKFYFSFRFFTFPDVVTDYLGLAGADFSAGAPNLKAGTQYLLKKSHTRISSH